MQLSRWSSICVFGLAVTLAGCDGAPKVVHPDAFPAAGVVTYNGSPVADADVVLMSPESKKAGWICSGRTGADGKFTIKTVFAPGTDASGAPAGDYTAVVLKTEAVAVQPTDMKSYQEQYKKTQSGGAPGQEPTSTGPKSLVPAKYATDATSDLKVKVEKAGAANIELKLAD